MLTYEWGAFTCLTQAPKGSGSWGVWQKRGLCCPPVAKPLNCRHEKFLWPEKWPGLGGSVRSRSCANFSPSLFTACGQAVSPALKGAVTGGWPLLWHSSSSRVLKDRNGHYRFGTEEIPYLKGKRSLSLKFFGMWPVTDEGIYSQVFSTLNNISTQPDSILSATELSGPRNDRYRGKRPAFLLGLRCQPWCIPKRHLQREGEARRAHCPHGQDTMRATAPVLVSCGSVSGHHKRAGLNWQKFSHRSGDRKSRNCSPELNPRCWQGWAPCSASRAGSSPHSFQFCWLLVTFACGHKLEGAPFKPLCFIFTCPSPVWGDLLCPPL